MAERPGWMDYRPADTEMQAAAERADDNESMCWTCERFVCAARLNDCPNCGDEV